MENWSAFAPDFKGALIKLKQRIQVKRGLNQICFFISLELDENVEYEERESEFDLADEDKSVTQNEREIEDDLEVKESCRMLTGSKL